jgi:hypothetical protein
MKTTRTILLTAALWFTAAAVVSAANPHIGTWKLNESKSKFADGSTKNHTVSYTEGEGGMITVTVDGTDKDGKAVHWTLQCKFDGKSYKVEGNPNVDEMVYKKVDEHTNKITGTKDGKTVMTGTITVNKDGKSRTVNTTTTRADGKKATDKAVYDKE